MNQVRLASDELTRRNLSDLQKTISTFNKQSSDQTEKKIVLTKKIVWLTVAMLIGLIIQIYLSL